MKKYLKIINTFLYIFLIVCVLLLGIEIYKLYSVKHNNQQLQVLVENKDNNMLEPNWEELQAQNQDIIGWIYIPNTPINYPIVYNKNYLYYLTHDSLNKKSQYGAIFLDSSNNKMLLDYNNIIHGHNVLGQNIMFSSLKNYFDPEFFNKNPYFYILTPQQNYQVQVSSASKVLAENELYNTTITNDKMKQFYQTIINNSTLQHNININDDDKLITLSTCDLSFGLNTNHRLAITGILKPYNQTITI